ncbi:phosphatidylinositol N-acetylglucosaminyltransferase subunit Gpi15p [Monosporozyma unispora]|nr:hypothetical protein C6P44_004048 [Kazachstania unispora]
MKTQSNDIRRIRRSQYEIFIEEECQNETFVEITISPSNYSRKIILNWVTVFIINYLLQSKLLLKFDVLNEYRKWVRIGVFVLSVFLIKSPKVEQITVIKDYGIQLSHWNGYIIFPYKMNKHLTQMREFISRDKIVDVIINEGFYQWYQVIFYLCIITRNEKKLKIMFPGHIKMKLEDEKLIYQLCQRYLYLKKDKLKHDCLH